MRHLINQTPQVFRVESGQVQDNPIVTFYQHNSNMLAKSEPATIIVEPSVSEDEFLKILLFLLWSKRLRIRSGNIPTSDAIGLGIVADVIATMVAALG